MSANSSATVEGKRSRHGSTAAATGQEDIHREECWSETSEATKGRETTASQTHRWSGCFFRHRPQSIDLLWYLQRSSPGAILSQCGAIRIPTSTCTTHTTQSIQWLLIIVMSRRESLMNRNRSMRSCVSEGDGRRQDRAAFAWRHRRAAALRGPAPPHRCHGDVVLLYRTCRDSLLYLGARSTGTATHTVAHVGPLHTETTLYGS